ncbi:MAG: hypothetical protein WBC20_12325 [Candidatus Aminicenantaceae bacterium]
MMRIADEHVWKANMMIGSKPTAVFAAIIVLFINTPILSLFAGRQDQGSSSADLNAILAKAAEYADRLERAALDFVCCEEIKEWLDPTLDAKLELSRGRTDYDPITGEFKTWQGAKEIKKSYVYDYQCIRKQGKIHETRTLLKENGKEKKEAKASLKTTIFRYGTSMLGPVSMFGTRFQPRYQYTVVGEKKIKGQKVIIVDADPLIDDVKSTNLYGKAWIAVEAGDILKIEWNEERIGRYKIFEERGKKFNRTPRITVVSEFQAEKNGLRFPTQLYIEEAYLNKYGRAFIRSKTTVTYKDFRFFTVEVEIRYRPQRPPKNLSK